MTTQDAQSLGHPAAPCGEVASPAPLSGQSAPAGRELPARLSGEVLHLAAQAHGFIDDATNDDPSLGLHKAEDGRFYMTTRAGWQEWTPDYDDAQAFRLAVKVGIAVEPYPIYAAAKHSVLAKQYRHTSVLREANPTEVIELYGDDANAATRRAIVRAAARIGEQS